MFPLVALLSIGYGGSALDVVPSIAPGCDKLSLYVYIYVFFIVFFFFKVYSRQLRYSYTIIVNTL